MGDGGAIDRDDERGAEGAEEAAETGCGTQFCQLIGIGN